MANHTVIASGTTRVRGVGIKTLYMAAPRPKDLTAEAERRVETDTILVRTGATARVLWGLLPGAESYEIELQRLRMTDMVGQVVLAATVTAPLYNWTPTKAGIYLARVRARINGQFTGWVNSNEPAITDNGASRGWLLQVYLAPVSGGGIR